MSPGRGATNNSTRSIRLENNFSFEFHGLAVVFSAAY